METVQFISCEDDDKDLIVSFALAYGDMDIRSLTLLRTPVFEPLLDDYERGVSVSLEDDDDVHLLAAVKFEANFVTIETQASTYDLDIGRVDPAEVSEMKAPFKRMNFDNRFRIEEV